MILTKPGKLCIDQDVVATAEDSDNVIQVVDASQGIYDALDGAILNISNSRAISDATGTLTIDLVLAREATLDNTVLLDRFYLPNGTDYRIAGGAGAPLHQFVIPDWATWLARTISAANSDCDMFLGLLITTTTFTAYLNAAITTIKQPASVVQTQVTMSNVGVPDYKSSSS
jgi:hypothetical protein